ncbi:C3HC zinc finger-like-domain-containing protein [Syncephalis fuscata]|nr:C3HC zinc finger-like-domain-containing protein [Syncephalis fuscata]
MQDNHTSHNNQFITKRKLAQAISALDEQTTTTITSKKPLTLRSVVQFGASVSSPLSPVTRTIGSREEEGALGPYRPWSRYVATWFDKPEALSPVVCARYGWINEKADLLACPTCHGRLIVDLGSAVADTSEYNELLHSYQLQLLTAHKTVCPWHERPCDKTVYRFPIQSRSMNESALKERINSIVPLSDQLPVITVEALVSVMPLLLEWTATLPSIASLDTTHQSSIVALAIYGWRADNTIKTLTLCCDLCYQKIDPRLYTTPIESIDESDIDNDDRLLQCDPLSEHRWYCPWIQKEINASILNSTTTTSASTSTSTSTALMTGWEYVVRDVCTLIKERNNTQASLKQDTTSITVSDHYYCCY